MNLVIVLVGVAFLIGASLVIGFESHARNAAWRRIAEARRNYNERERALLRCVEQARCDRCPMNDYLR